MFRIQPLPVGVQEAHAEAAADGQRSDAGLPGNGDKRIVAVTHADSCVKLLLQDATLVSYTYETSSVAKPCVHTDSIMYRLSKSDITEQISQLSSEDGCINSGAVCGQSGGEHPQHFVYEKCMSRQFCRLADTPFRGYALPSA